MNLLLTFVFALFPLLHQQVYPVTYQSCSDQGIFLKVENEVVEVQLFNVSLNEAGKTRVCERLAQASKITMSIDAASKIEAPVPVYLFVDGTLLQEEVLKNKEAYITIRNPEYQYEQQMEQAVNDQTTMASTKTKDKKLIYEPSTGYRFLLICIGIWGILGYFIIRPWLKKRF